MNRKQTQQSLKDERHEYRIKLKIFLRQHRITQRQISDYLGIEETEFHNMLTGYQSSIPTKNIHTFEEFQIQVNQYLGL